MIKVHKTWVKLGNTYCLLMEVNGKIFTKQFVVERYNKDVVDLNKKLKEFDLIDTIRKMLDLKDLVITEQ